MIGPRPRTCCARSRSTTHRSSEYDTLLAPLRWPRKVVCAGINYRKHIKEMGGEITPGWKPFFFMKPPTTTVIGPHDPIPVHRPETARYDWEVELAIVIGIGGRDIPLDKALSHVAGYCVANDISARGNHKRTVVPADAFVYDWFASKAIDGSLPWARASRLPSRSPTRRPCRCGCGSTASCSRTSRPPT